MYIIKNENNDLENLKNVSAYMIHSEPFSGDVCTIFTCLEFNGNKKMIKASSYYLGDAWNEMYEKLEEISYTQEEMMKDESTVLEAKINLSILFGKNHVQLYARAENIDNLIDLIWEKMTTLVIDDLNDRQSRLEIIELEREHEVKK